MDYSPDLDDQQGTNRQTGLTIQQSVTASPLTFATGFTSPSARWTEPKPPYSTGLGPGSFETEAQAPEHSQSENSVFKSSRSRFETEVDALPASTYTFERDRQQW